MTHIWILEEVPFLIKNKISINGNAISATAQLICNYRYSGGERRTQTMYCSAINMCIHE